MAERTLDTMSEAIALSSPSGRMSKRSRKAAQDRLAAALFGPSGLLRPAPSPQTSEQRDCLLRTAAELRDLAARGMKPRAHVKRAEQLEAQARALLDEVGRG